MNTVRTIISSADLSDGSEGGFLSELGAFFRQFIVAAFDSYRPEQHYMRGPGPACRARRESGASLPTRM